MALVVFIDSTYVKYYITQYTLKPYLCQCFIDISNDKFYIEGERRKTMLDIDRIRLRRLELRLSQRALGQAIKQDQAYVSRVENGIIKDVTADTLWRMSRTLDVSMEELLILDADYEPEPPAKPRNSRRKPVVTQPTVKAPAPKRARTPAPAAKR